MNNYEEKIDKNLFSLIENIKNPKILELGVQNGVSTKKFINLCEKNDGYLYAVDIEDCSKVSNSQKWKFIHSRDDDFENIKNQIDIKLDILYIDSLHESNHVKKLIYNYYDLINIGGYIFIDDISHLPYLDNPKKSSFYCEINNKETFNMLLEIYYYNQNFFDINFSFNSSGLAVIKKKTDNTLNFSKPLKEREFSFKNFLRKIWMRIKN